MTSLELYLHDRFVGLVEPDRRDKSRVTLAIDRAFRSDVVLSESFAAIPGRRPATELISNFLGGYVPEGNHREKMAAKRHVDQDDLFALLAEFGGSIAGAVTLRRPDDAQSREPSYAPLNARDLTALLKQALAESDQGVPDDSRSALPGYQPKVLVAKFNSELAYPHGRAHSTHILKPQVPGREHRIFDEFYSHQLTREIGLSTFDSKIMRAGRITYLAIERFDRTVDGDRVRLHHQEDLAQAMSLDWRESEVKFQEPAWPNDPRRATLRRVGELLGSIPEASALVEQWVQQLTYHVAVGNNDAHAKNIALVHLENGTKLAEVYDAVPNLFQDELINWNLALAVDGKFDLRRISAESIASEAASWGTIREARAYALVEQTLAALDDALAKVEPPREVSPGMTDRLRWNVMRLRQGNEISTPKR